MRVGVEFVFYSRVLLLLYYNSFFIAWVSLCFVPYAKYNDNDLMTSTDAYIKN
jgi:hypothetical protein